MLAHAASFFLGFCFSRLLYLVVMRDREGTDVSVNSAIFFVILSNSPGRSRNT